VEWVNRTSRRVVDKTYLYDSRGVPLRPYSLTHAVVHRLSLSNYQKMPVADLALTSEGIVMRFCDLELGTGGRPPYHVHVFGDGRVEQVLPLTIRGSHARGFNWRSIGVAVIGNTDEREIGGVQLYSLIWVLRVLRPLNKGLTISGHTELPGATSDPNKRCPGKYLSMEWVRASVAENPVVSGDVWNAAERVGFTV